VSLLTSKFFGSFFFFFTSSSLFTAKKFGTRTQLRSFATEPQKSTWRNLRVEYNAAIADVGFFSFSFGAEEETQPTTTTTNNNNNQLSLVDQLIQGKTNPKSRIPSWLTLPAIKKFVKEFPQMTREVLQHYWMGTKLLWLNTRLSMKIAFRVLRGHKMSRRERRLLVRTMSDLFRLVPFSVFVIVPFMELTLPIFLKLFPNMLPSTFDDKMKQAEALRKQLQLKVEMARFLKETVMEMQPSSEKVEGDFGEFFRKLRDGEMVHPSELVKYAKFFEDEITLDGLERSQLMAMCKILGMKPFGPDAFLRYQLKSRLDQLKKDDIQIRDEGIDNLTLEELQQACHARGMPGYNSKNSYLLKRRMEGWLELSLDRNLPVALLLLSRAFQLTARAGLEDVLKDTIATMPQELIDEIELRIETKAQDKVDRSLKLEVLEHYRELVEEEAEEEAEQLEEKKEKRGADVEIKPIAEALTTLASPVEPIKQDIQELQQAVRQLRVEGDVNAAVEEVKNMEEERERLEREERERAELKARREMEPQAAAALPTEEELLKAQKEREQKVREERERTRTKEVKSIRRLESKLEEMINSLNAEVEQAEPALQEGLNLIDRNKDGLISRDEIVYALNVFQQKVPSDLVDNIVERLDKDKDGLVSVDELIKLAREYDIDLPKAVAEQQEADRVASLDKKTPSQAAADVAAAAGAPQDKKK
jgi:LETM1 and EF-hand domain-containing protein 1, mitochondrial